MEIRQEGMKTLGGILTSKDIEALVNRIGTQFENFERAAVRTEKDSKKFWWGQICRHLFSEEWEDSRNKNLIFKKILGQTHNFTLGEIRSIFEKAVRWRKNPPALFWKLVREKQAEIRKQITKV